MTTQKVVVDLSKPKGQREQYIDLTPDEIAEREAQAAQAEAERLELEAAELAKAEAKETALAKLSALGLTEAEVTALLGA